MTCRMCETFRVTRVVFCSGKHYYTLDNYRVKQEIRDTAIIRLEVQLSGGLSIKGLWPSSPFSFLQLLCPFPSAYIYQELTRYPKAKGMELSIIVVINRLHNYPFIVRIYLEPGGATEHGALGVCWAQVSQTVGMPCKLEHSLLHSSWNTNSNLIGCSLPLAILCGSQTLCFPSHRCIQGSSDGS